MKYIKYMLAVKQLRLIEGIKVFGLGIVVGIVARSTIK